MCVATVRLTQDELAHLEQVAATTGQTLSDALREAMRLTPESDIRAWPVQRLRLVETAGQ